MEFYYTSPAGSWINGLPIGNGRLAAMVQETETYDEVTMNHEWLWEAGIRHRHANENAKYLPLVRQIFKEGRLFEAAVASNLLYSGKTGVELDNPDSLQKPALAAEVSFYYSSKENKYLERRLDITKGVATVKRLIDSATVTSTYFASFDDGLLHYSWEADKPFSGELTLTRRPMMEAESDERVDVDPYCKLDPISHGENEIILGGILTDCVFVDVERFENKLVYKTDGKVTPTEKGIFVEGATYIHAVVNIATSGKNEELILEDNPCVLPEDFAGAKAKHCDIFEKFISRVEFNLEGKDTSLDQLTTDRRVALMKTGSVDNGICEMYFDFGRYLMASGTYMAELPTHLQGKWNNMVLPPWDSDFHMDINLQMNYWAAESINMPEAALGLINFLNKNKESGKETARNLYGCRGIVYPISTDVSGDHYGVYGWGAWTGAAAWLGQHIWWHYVYSGDVDFLRDHAYDYFVQVAEFYEDFMYLDENGVYQLSPSYSPENPLKNQPYLPVALTVSCSTDVQFVYDSLNYAIKSAKILGVDEDKVARWEEILRHIPEFKIGSDGRLMEWSEEYEEFEPGHRHLSHLYGVYPSSIFTPETRAPQYNAAIRSLEFRMEHGGGHTGWSRAWCACLFARLKRKADFYEHYTALIKDFAAETLLDLHPPHLFQIEGNFGGVAAVVEAIVSCYDDKVFLLDALPDEWASGSLKGIKVPGGHTVDIEWKDGRAVDVTVTLGFAKSITVVVEGKEHTISGEIGEEFKLEL